MPTEHCKLCEPGENCGNGHVYVLQLDNGSDDVEWLYVGSTGKSVEDRWDDNLRRNADEGFRLCTLKEARKIGEDGGWKYGNSKNARIRDVRRHYLRHRPDLYLGENPTWPEKPKDIEDMLSEKLERIGHRVDCA